MENRDISEVMLGATMRSAQGQAAMREVRGLVEAWGLEFVVEALACEAFRQAVEAGVEHDASGQARYLRAVDGLLTVAAKLEE